MGWFLLKRVDLVVVRVIYTSWVETIPADFYWLTWKNQKFVQSKPLQQRLYVLILRCWQCRQVYVHYVMYILMICKLANNYIYQVASREFTCCDLFWKRIDPKNFLFIGINNWTHVLEIQLWSVNYTFVARIRNNNANDQAKTVYIRFWSQ